jgi:RNA polymerase sigma-70 factor (ECF subfamily)
VARRQVTRPFPLSADDPLPPEDRVLPVRRVPSLDLLYRVQAPRLLRLFARRGGDDAPDLVQDAFERLARRDETATIDRPDHFLSRVATNLLRDRAKFAARRAAAFHVSLDDVALGAGDPHDQLEARDAIARLEVTMARLRPRTRDIFLACRLDGYTHAEIAERMGMSVRSVRKEMTRAIAAIDRDMAER